jgi:hypothetical protein
MKKNILLLLLLTSTFAFSQNKNFSIENSSIYWKYIYQDSTNISELKNNPKLEFKTDSTGIIKRTNFNDKKLKDLVGEFKIESKKDKYRVSIYNIRFYVEPIGLHGGGLSMQTISEYSIEQSLIKKNGTIRESYLGYNLTETLNPHLEILFTIQKTKKNDW